MSPLRKLYQHVLKQADFTYPWQELVSFSLHEGEESGGRVEALKNTLTQIDLSTPQECFFFFRHFLILTLISPKGRRAESLAPLFEHAKGAPFWEESPLAKLYYALCSTLCEKQVDKGALPTVPLIERGDRWKGGASLKVQEVVEYALLMGILGLLHDEIGWQLQAVECAQWIVALLDHRDFPFYSLWSSETGCDLPSILAFNYVLFSLCDSLTKHPKWLLLRDRQLDHLERLLDGSHADLPLLPPLFDTLLGEIDSGLSFCFEEGVQAPPLFLKGAFERASYVCTLTGENSGIGAFHKEGVRIVNFGPWSTPLGECAGFGLKRQQRPTGESSKDVLRGWTRFQPTLHTSDTWGLIDIAPSEERLNLKVCPTPVTEEGQLSFAFLVQSEQAQIGNHWFLPGTMRHYVGESSLVTFYSKKEKIEIITDQKREVELIPLAGGRHFWGANFLLAFSFSPSERGLSCSIS